MLTANTTQSTESAAPPSQDATVVTITEEHFEQPFIETSSTHHDNNTDSHTTTTTPTPLTRAFRPISTETRLIIPFTKTNYTTHSHGINEPNVPNQLLQKGLTQHQWTQILDSLHQIQKKIHTTVTHDSLAHIPLINMYEIHHESGYYTALSTWLTNINNDVCIPLGMFCKLQTCQFNGFVNFPEGHVINDGKFEHEECSWLAVGLEKEECDKLKREPVFWKVAKGRHVLVPSKKQHDGRVV
ncbi:hypothetical protein HDU76_002537 [Blyttiomyces sp. JEL0837]|nr:hypothetical protein HDU76_002537 [Blyttiomyces sp. JEL0837]